MVTLVYGYACEQVVKLIVWSYHKIVVECSWLLGVVCLWLAWWPLSCTGIQCSYIVHVHVCYIPTLFPLSSPPSPTLSPFLSNNYVCVYTYLYSNSTSWVHIVSMCNTASTHTHTVPSPCRPSGQWGEQVVRGDQRRPDQWSHLLQGCQQDDHWHGKCE